MSRTAHLVNDWQTVKNKVEAHSWAKRIVSAAKQDTDWWVAHYEDDASRIAGWGHNYFCEHCYAMLAFDRAEPYAHKCGGCGQVRRDDTANEAWNASYRSQSCSQVFSAAVLYNLYEDASYLQFIRNVLQFYCDHYGHFSVRTPPGVEGTFAGIDLADGVAVTQLMNGLELVKDFLTEDELALYKSRFFIPLAAFLTEKVGCTPNINCWMRAAAGMIGLFFNERIWCERAAAGEHGIRQKLAEGLLPSGFWYEGSFQYHFYNASGLTYYLAFCKLYGYEFPELENGLLSMYRYPVLYAFPNGQFPSPNDGWPFLTFNNFAHQYEWIRNVCDEAPFRYALAQCYDDANDGGLPRLLFGTDWKQEAAGTGLQGEGLPDGKSRCDQDIYFSLLQNGDAAVFMKYGFMLEGHSHADIMNIELFLKDEIISRDISNTGYNSDLFREWQRKTIAHNSVMVDCRNQPNRPRGQLLAFDSERNLCRAAADGVYPGIRFERHLELLGDRLSDEFVVASEPGHSDTHTFDWIFYCSGELEHRLPVSKAEPPGDQDGYQLMMDTVCCDVDGDWEVRWVLQGKALTLKMAGCPGTRLFLFRGNEHRLDKTRWGVMVRRTGTGATFRAEHHFS